MEDEMPKRAKNFDSAFNSAQLRQDRNIRFSELRKNKRAEAVYSKREFVNESNVQTSLDSELTLNYLKSPETEDFLLGANSFARIINEEHDNSFIDLCISELLGFYQYPDQNRSFISTSLLASVSNSSYSKLLTRWISLLVSLIAQTDVKTQENLYWALGNIALDSDENRELILTSDFLTISFSLINNPQSVHICKKICWCISHCCKGKFFENQSKVLPFLSLAVRTNIIDILPEVLWALAHISDKQVDLIQETEFFQVFIKFTKVDVVKFQQPALRVIGNLLSGSEVQVDTLVNAGVVKSLSYCLESRAKIIRQEAMWAFSNLCATKYVGMLVAKGVIKRIIDLSITDNQDVQNEAVWSLFNAIFVSSPSDLQDLVNLGLLSAVCYLVNLVGNQAKMLLLKSIEKVLKAGEEFSPNPYVLILEGNGGKETIEQLQLSRNRKIVAKSGKIISEFFENEVKDIQLLPTDHFEF